MQKIRNWLYKFMYGRNGADYISKLLIIPIIIVFILCLFLKGNARFIVSIIGWILIIYSYFRMFSKNVSKRRAECAFVQKKINYLKTRTKQSKDYRFFNCPNCGTHLRVPKGVGKITITCKKCGTKFDRKA